MISSAGTELISVVIPSYNRRELLRRAVESALLQKDVTVEVLICDDGSDDGTAEDWLQYPDSRVRFLHLPHGGACAARNAGIDAASGAYIAFLDSDDTWREEKLSVQLRLLKESGADAAACGFCRHEGEEAVCIPENIRQTGDVDREKLLQANFISTQTILGKTDCIRSVKFDERFPRMQDWDFVLAFTKKHRMVIDPAPMADVYVQRDSISVHDDKALQALRLMMQKYRDDYAASYQATVAVLYAVEEYAGKLHGSCLADCFRAMQRKWGFRKNLLLLVRWAKMKMHGAE